MTQPPCFGLILYLDVVGVLVSGDVDGAPAKAVMHPDDGIGLMLVRFAEIEARLRVGGQRGAPTLRAHPRKGVSQTPTATLFFGSCAWDCAHETGP